MEAAKNPYKKGSACYLAWESGYLAALEDVNKLAEESKKNDPAVDGSLEDWTWGE